MTEMTKMLLEFHIVIKTNSKDSRTTLYLAAERSGWTEVTKLLLEDNGDIKAND